ncbi:MAG: glucose-1-phosphate cytidylyltransferase [archaeon]
MKVVILAGGFGTRFSEETHKIPKPMVEIGDKPLLWHIMKIYSHQGYNDFIICLGYRGYIIKEYFANYFLHNSDATIDLKNNEIKVHKAHGDNWKVTLVNTGMNTLTGGRIKRVADFIGGETFMLTYGDGVADVNIPKLVDFHKKKGKLATLTCVQPEGRFGALTIKDDHVHDFSEKKDNHGRWINGGFFVLEPETLDYIQGDHISWEKEPLERLAREGQLAAFHHTGFWAAMDKLHDKMRLEDLWNSGDSPWKTWND